jgi:hypothetical protein
MQSRRLKWPIEGGNKANREKIQPQHSIRVVDESTNTGGQTSLKASDQPPDRCSILSGNNPTRQLDRCS